MLSLRAVLPHLHLELVDLLLLLSQLIVQVTALAVNLLNFSLQLMLDMALVVDLRRERRGFLLQVELDCLLLSQLLLEVAHPLMQLLRPVSQHVLDV